MLYSLHEAAYNSATPVRIAAGAARDFWGSPLNPASNSKWGRTLFASSEMLSNLTRRYGRPSWGIEQVTVKQQRVAVRQEVVWKSPWVKLRRFSREPIDLRRARAPLAAPPLLIVAPLSGHYATLLRGTVETFLQDFDVYVTDWSNARDVPIIEGRFDFHDYIDQIRDILRHIGERAHVVAVCQPGPPVLAATALLAEDDDPHRPASVSFLGSPLDARLAPTATNRLAEDKPFSWFQQAMIYTVPTPYGGVLRRVYPGFVQLYSFLSMNAEKHQEAHRRYFDNLVDGDGDSAEKHREFYDEYLSVLDLTEEFYLQTVDIVFQRYLLPKGELTHRDRKVNLGAITDVATMSVEGENDDISGVGQTQAVHALLPNLPNALHELYVQPKVGHYGVFNGRRFNDEIYPRIRAFIERSEAAVVAG
ncbi:MAG: polyhydroxyalkanoate depolymerase [Caulobacteraceae bacterium]